MCFPTLASGYLALADACVRVSHPELAVQVLHDGLRKMPNASELQERLARLGRR